MAEGRVDNFKKIYEFLIKKAYGLGVNFPCLFEHYLNLIGADSVYKKDHIIQNEKEYMKHYMKLRRFILSLAKKGLVQLSKVDGLLWIKPTPAIVDLIINPFNACKTQTPVKTPDSSSHEQPENPQKHPLNNRIHPSRARARRILESKKNLKPEDWEELYDCFNEYTEDASNRVIVLKLFDEEEFLFLRYQHRFKKKRLKKVLKRFNEAWKKASSEHNVGVFITLTMDPSTYSNLMEALVKSSEAFNRFMSYLRKFFGFRPLYIKVLEAQDSGNPHFHVVLFGVERIMDHYELTEVLERLGFGQIHYEYKIIKDKSGKWVWANPKVRRTMRRDVQDYLKKYMTESFCSVLGYNKNKLGYNKKDKNKGSEQQASSSSNQDLGSFKISYYFASNRRFFTCSMQLLTKTERKYASAWIFVGSWYWHDVPDWILDAAGVIIVPDDELGWRAVSLVGGVGSNYSQPKNSKFSKKF